MSNIDKYELVELELPAKLEAQDKGEVKIRAWEDEKGIPVRFRAKVVRHYDRHNYGKHVSIYEVTDIKSW